MLQVKNGVDLAMIDPRMWAAIPKILEAYKEYDAPCVITSGRDSKHSCRSKHYYGAALDFRVRDPEGEWALSEMQKALLTERISHLIGPDFDVLNEGDHIHAEFDPK